MFKEPKRVTFLLLGTRAATVTVQNLLRDRSDITTLRCDAIFPIAHYAANLNVLHEGYMNVTLLFCIDYFAFHGPSIIECITKLDEMNVAPPTIYPLLTIYTECLTSTTESDMTQKLRNLQHHSPWIEHLLAAPTLLMRLTSCDARLALETFLTEASSSPVQEPRDEQVQVEIQPAIDGARGCYVAVTMRRSRPQSVIGFHTLPCAHTKLISERGIGEYRCRDTQDVYYMQETRLLHSTNSELVFWLTEDDSLLLSLTLGLATQ